MKTKFIRAISSICAAVILIAAFSVGAFAATSIADQMAANSAAWWVAYNAGDTATCNALHEANVALADQLAGSSGKATYNTNGTWDIVTSSGDKISSADTDHNQKNNTVTYTTTTSSGHVSSISKDSYTDDSINAYMNNGGTKTGLQTSYNNAAEYVSTTGSYGTDRAQTSAEAEVAVVKALLGLTNAQARQLQSDLEASKQAFESAQAEYYAAQKAGDTEAAAAAKAQMTAAHEAAEATRAAYNYTGDSSNYHDGGYYYANGGTSGGSTPSDGGGFFITDVKPTYKITARATGGGSISPSAEVSVKKGESVTFTMTPDPGARLIRVLVDGRSVGARTSYTFTNVRAAHTITAEFYKSTYSITASAGTGGTISPSGTRTVAYNKTINYRISPNPGYAISKVLVDGQDIGATTSYTFSNVKNDHTIKAVFEKNGFTITANAGEGGTISPAGTTQVVKHGSVNYRITPLTGWKIKSVYVDGRDVGAMSVYIFSGITSDHTISAQFERRSYSISASAGNGGTISPSGTSSVLYGDNMTYHITPNAGYEVDHVVVDGQNKGQISSYTFTNVSDGHSITAYFRVAGRVEVGTPSVTDNTGASLNGSSIKSGYGIKVEVPVTAVGVTDVKVVLTYNFGGGTKTVNLEQSGSKYVLPANSASPTSARVVYIPVETQDGTYTLNVAVTAKKADGSTITETVSAAVTVLGNMYEDDFTGDS